MGPLVPSEGYTNLLTIIDRTTRWPEAIPMVNTSTTECARALIRHWISRLIHISTGDPDTQDNRLSLSIQWNNRKVSSNIEGSAKSPPAMAQLGG